MYNMKIEHTDAVTNSIRSGIEQRALWLYEFVVALKQQGLDYEKICREVMLSCGKWKGTGVFHPVADAQDLAKQYLPEGGKKAFEAQLVSCSDDEFVVESYYCPLLAMWEKLTDDEELIRLLCDVAMDGDRGTMACFEDFEFQVEKAIPFGYDRCRVKAYKRNGGHKNG